MPRSNDRDLPEVEVVWEGSTSRTAQNETPLPDRRWVLVAAAIAATALVAGAALWPSGPRDTPAAAPPVIPAPSTVPSAPVAETAVGDHQTGAILDALLLAAGVPDELLAAELYRARPSAETLRALFDALGGVDGLTVGTAKGAFDIVTFDPADPDRLLAAMRASYGEAENQTINEVWRVGDGEVTQALFAPQQAHDYSHFNSDGSLTVWQRSETSAAFASRRATTDSGGGDVVTSAPVFASRSVVVAGTLFALSGSSDYYDPSTSFVALIADRDGDVVVLDDGAEWGWVDSPAPGVAVSYPATDAGQTMAWDPSSLEPLPDHPLSGLRFQRMSLSQDETVGLGVTLDGRLQVFDPRTGWVRRVLGDLDPHNITGAVTVSAGGETAVTVNWDGTVSIWWLRSGTEIVAIDAHAGPARVMPERRAPRVSSSVAPSAERVALLQPARPATKAMWRIVETDPDTWVRLACERAGRTLSPAERAKMGLDPTTPACG